MYFQYIHPTAPQQIESSRDPEVVVNNRFHPPAFQQTIDPISSNSLMPRNSCLLPNHLWSYLNWVGSISTSLQVDLARLWRFSPNVDGQRPWKNTGWQPNVEMAVHSHVCEGKNRKDHKRPIKNPGSKSSRLSTKIVFPIWDVFFHKSCRHRNYYIPIKSTTGGSHTYSMVEIWTKTRVLKLVHWSRKLAWISFWSLPRCQ